VVKMARASRTRLLLRKINSIKLTRLLLQLL
jgi:hypothetical protein